MELRNNNSVWVQKGTTRFDYSDNIKVKDTLDSGLYCIDYCHRNYVVYAEKININNDSLIDLGQTEVDEVYNMIVDFCEKKDDYTKWNFKYKRGCLLYGVPGTGKTSIISKSIQYFIEKMNGVCFIIKNATELEHYNTFYTKFRGIEPDRMVLAIYEDIDGIVGNNSSETLLINMLDGIGDMGNIFNIATTNYTESLSDRLAKRPGRFDRKIEIKSPNYNVRKNFLESKINKEDLVKINIDDWCKKTEGFTIAELSEFVKSYFLCGLSFQDSFDAIKFLEKSVSSHQYNKDAQDNTIGFKKK